MEKLTSEQVGNKWIMAAKNKNGLQFAEIMCRDASLFPPFIDKEIVGFKSVMSTFAGFSVATKEFRYGKLWCNENNFVLEFEAKLNHVKLHALEVVELDELGKIKSVRIHGNSLDGLIALKNSIETLSWFKKLRIFILTTSISIAALVLKKN